MLFSGVLFAEYRKFELKVMKRLHLLLFECLLAAAALASPCRADVFSCEGSIKAEQRNKLLPAIESAYRTIGDLRAQFVQRSYFAGLDKSEYSKGAVSFKKPGMMDWDYQEPEKQRFVADGKTLWFYQPELRQVTINDFERAFSSDIPVSFLLGLGSLQENFSLQQACRSERGLALELTPQKPDSTLQRFFLTVEPTSYLPVAAKVVDISGNETTITLINSEINKGISEQQFVFAAPQGVDVIDQRKSTPIQEPERKRPIIREMDVGPK